MFAIFAQFFTAELGIVSKPAPGNLRHRGVTQCRAYFKTGQPRHSAPSGEAFVATQQSQRHRCNETPELVSSWPLLCADGVIR